MKLLACVPVNYGQSSVSGLHECAISVPSFSSLLKGNEGGKKKILSQNETLPLVVLTVNTACCL